MKIELSIGNINVTKDILNEIAIMAYCTSEYYKERKLDALSNRYMNIADKIHDELDIKGYYNSIN